MSWFVTIVFGLFVAGWLCYFLWFAPCAAFHGNLKYWLGVPARCLEIKP